MACVLNARTSQMGGAGVDKDVGQSASGNASRERSSVDYGAYLGVDWTPELHRRFVQAVEQLGVDKAIPSRILELMGVKSLTRHNIASHLQKYRSHRRHLAARDAEAANWHTNRAPADSGASAGAWPAGAAAAAAAPAGTPGASGSTWGPGVPPAGAAVSGGGTPANAVANGVPNGSPGGVSHGVPTGHPAAMMPPRQMPGMMPPCPPMPFRHQPYGNMPMMHPHQSSPAMGPMMPHPPPAMGMPVWGHPTTGGASPGGFPRTHMWGHMQQQQQQQQQCQAQQQPQQQMQPRVAAYPPPSWLAVDGSSPWHHYPAFPAGPPPMDAWPHPGMPARGMPCFPPRQHQHPLSYPMPPNGPPNGAASGPPGMVCGAPVCPPNAMPPNGYPHTGAPPSGSHANGAPAMMPPPSPFLGMPMMPGLPHAPSFGPSPGHGWGMGAMLSGTSGGGGGGGDGGAGDAAHVADEAMPNPMFPLSDDLTVDLAAISASIGDDLHEFTHVPISLSPSPLLPHLPPSLRSSPQANDILDAAISEALTNPATPLPLGLKPPSLDGVLDELNRQGIRMPASTAAAAAAAAAGAADAGDVVAADAAGSDGAPVAFAALADADMLTAAAGVDGDGDDEGLLSLTDYPAGLFCSAEAMAAAASFLKEEAV
ncbi:unnamed protein product [Closterium sp. NIES-65]|nr:unnamed protein product [Closterium sp. NIES-65]